MKTHTIQGKLQALVYDDILPPRRKVPESDARSVGSRACLALRYLLPSRMILHLDWQRCHLLFSCSFIKVWRAGSLDSRVVCDCDVPLVRGSATDGEAVWGRGSPAEEGGGVVAFVRGKGVSIKQL